MPAKAFITVRYFAGARAATGLDEETVLVDSSTPTLADLRRALTDRHGVVLATALPACSFLLDGLLLRDGAHPLPPGSSLDVLPPFAGG